MLTPTRLWSLWDVYILISATDFHDLMISFEELCQNLDKAPSSPFSDKGDGEFSRFFQRLEEISKKLECRTALAAASECVEKIKTKNTILCSEMVNYIRRIKDILRLEMSSKKMFFITGSKEQYFEPTESLFGKEFETKFPKALFEVEEAGKCLALGRDTAAVFHLMRIMEIGLTAIRICLGISDPLKPGERNWGEILRKIKTAIDLLAKQDKDYFNSCYASLDAIRIAWRNTTMHVENKYTSDDAVNIFRVVRIFMNNLASRMDEKGMPKA